MPGLRWLLSRTRPDEDAAWRELAGESSSDGLPITALGRGEAHGFEPFVVRPLTAQLEIASAECAGRYHGPAMDAARGWPRVADLRRRLDCAVVMHQGLWMT